jgi:hypothetical protein
MNNSLQEWLTPANLTYVAECLQICANGQMVADLRGFIPPEALRQATARLSPKKREQIKAWVLALNSAREVAQ